MMAAAPQNPRQAPVASWNAQMIGTLVLALVVFYFIRERGIALPEVPADWKRYDWQFHQSLISACGSRALIDTHAAVFDKYLRYQMTSLSYRGDIASGEHRRMLDCALKRDWKTACDTLRRHVEGGMAHALATGTIR